ARIYEGDELAQTQAGSWEPWTAIFRLADDVGARARASCAGCGGRTSICAIQAWPGSASRNRSSRTRSDGAATRAQKWRIYGDSSAPKRGGDGSRAADKGEVQVRILARP